MAAKKDFTGAMNKMTGREVVLPGDKSKEGHFKPFGAGLREELERETEQMPIREIAVDQLQDNPFQHLARPQIDEKAMEELVSSIRANGFYGALLARRKKGLLEHYELAFGHRRKEAARRAGIMTLPVKVIELSEIQMARIMASENFAREDLTPLGEANVVGHLNTAQNLSVAEISRIVGKGEGWVNLRLGLYNAPADIKSMAEQKPETLGHVRLLVQVKDQAQRSIFITSILNGQLTREELVALVKPISRNTKFEPQIVKEDIVTNSTSTLPYRNGEIIHNQSYAVANSEGLEKLQKDVGQPPNAGVGTNTTPVIYHQGIEVRENEANYTRPVPLSTKVESEYAQALKNLGDVIERLEKYTEMIEVEPNHHQIAYLVEIMERLTLLLNKTSEKTSQ